MIPEQPAISQSCSFVPIESQGMWCYELLKDKGTIEINLVDDQLGEKGPNFQTSRRREKGHTNQDLRYIYEAARLSGKDRHGLIHSLKRVKKKKSKSSFCGSSLSVGTISSVSNDVCDVGKDVRVKLLA